jgi:hypothetical protein
LIATDYATIGGLASGTLGVRLATVGTWRDWQAFSVSGLERWGKFTVGAAGVAAGLALYDGANDYRGGYANITAFGQYWTHCRSVPSALTPVAIDWTEDENADLVDGSDSTMQLYGPRLVANVTCLSGVVGATGIARVATRPRSRWQYRVGTLNDIKLYANVAPEGDEITGRTFIQFAGRRSLEHPRDIRRFVGHYG